MTAAGFANEAGYVFRDRHPERGEVYRRFDEASAAARATLGGRLDLPYGPHPREKFDLFAGPAGAPLVVFVHGGYWQSLDKERYSFVAVPLLASGFSVALPGYPLAPEASSETIVASIRRCLPAIVAALGTPPAFAVASGHSAGGHLAAMLAMAEAPPVPIAACVPVSGIFDVEPIVETSLNAALGLDAVRARAISPIHLRPPAGCRLVAIVGEAETSAFVAQSQRFSTHWRAAGGDAELVSLAAGNHYTVLCDLLEGRSLIAEAIVGAAAAFGREEAGIDRY